MSTHDVLFPLGADKVALRISQTEERQEERQEGTQQGPLAGRHKNQPRIPMGRQHAPQHPSLSFIHDRSLRYGI